ncbi:MAG: DndE family protein [Bacteroidetes bacterium]|jgi:DNA sulfur modification protein DndE|nr:DndE family protein [Candidatus Woesearchaeota archaeon]MBT6686204.1 DndE family protein [Bacteroidota bacterium]MBT7144108.1 DndE family protein [Bacteroidota bacterium]MBT7489996.1 DndE family protein [Bacteroidota bacterium]
MFTHIKTSKENRELVSYLTRKLSLGTENIIARIAFTYSISKDRKMDLTKIQNSGGKEYSKAVLFGNNLPYYVSLICVHYNIYKTDKDIPKYIKMHIDDGLGIINEELKVNPNLDGFEYVIDKIENGLMELV